MPSGLNFYAPMELVFIHSDARELKQDIDKCIGYKDMELNFSIALSRDINMPNKS